MHQLLKKQLKKHLTDYELFSLSPNMQALLRTISATYEDKDKERQYLENTIELNSKEISVLNRVVKDKNHEISNQLLYYQQAVDTSLLVCITNVLFFNFG